MSKLGIDEVIIKHNVNHHKWMAHDVLIEILDELEIIKGKNIVARRPIQMSLGTVKCFVPYFKIALNPYGDVYSCCLASQPKEVNGYLLGDIKKDSIAKIWNLSKNLRASFFSKGVQCSSCNYTDYCLNRTMERRISMCK